MDSNLIFVDSSSDESDVYNNTTIEEEAAIELDRQNELKKIYETSSLYSISPCVESQHIISLKMRERPYVEINKSEVKKRKRRLSKKST